MSFEHFHVKNYQIKAAVCRSKAAHNSSYLLLDPDQKPGPRLTLAPLPNPPCSSRAVSFVREEPAHSRLEDPS